MIIADITKAIPGTEIGLLTALRREAGGDGKTIKCVLHQRQSFRVNGNGSDLELVQLGNYEHYSVVRQTVMRLILTELRAAPPDERIEVVSFHPAVLGLASEFPENVQPRVICRHWKAVRAPIAVPPASSDHINVLRELLAMFPNGIRKTALRDLLASKSPLFDKAAGGPTITSLLTHAQQAGAVHLDYSIDVANPIVRLTDASQTFSDPIGKAVERNGSAEHTAAIGQAALRQPPTSDPGQVATSTVSTRPTDADETAPVIEDEKKIAKRRRARYREILRGVSLGPYAALLDELFQALQTLADAKAYSPAVLIRKAVREVWNSYTARGIKLKLLWTDVERFLFALLGRQEILQGENDQMLNPRKADSVGKKVHSMRQDWRHLLEAELVYAILEGDRQVTASEWDDVGYVLFGADSPEGRWQRVEACIDLLLRAGRIDVDDAGRYLPKAAADLEPRPPES